MKNDENAKLHSMLYRLLDRTENAHPLVINMLPEDIQKWWKLNKKF